MRPPARSRALPLIALLAVPSFSLYPAAKPKPQEGSETIDPSGKLRVQCNGNIRIRGASGNKLTYRFTNGNPGNDAVSIQREGQLTVFRCAADVQITVPRTLKIAVINTPAGDLDAGDLEGSLIAEAAGKITIGRIGGDVEVHSAGGPTSLDAIGGLVRCISGGGRIVAGSIQGDAHFETGAGDIVVQKCSGEVQAYTAGGGIRIGHADRAVTANTNAGPISIGYASGLRCESASGAIQVTNASGSMNAATIAGSIIAQFLPGFPVMDSFLSTGAGDITVYIPSNLQISIRAQNRGTGNIRSVVSDFPEVHTRSFGGVVVAEAKLNGGGPLLQLTGTGGSIYIRRK